MMTKAAAENGSKSWRSFRRRHWHITAVFVVGAVLAAIGAGGYVHFGETDFFIDGAQIGKGFTDASGRVFINFVPPTSGTEQLLAVFLGIEQYEGYAPSSSVVSIQVGP
jgi:hypothetical protein